MLRSRLFFVPGFLGFCLFLLAPTLAEAQHGGHGGGGHGGGGHGGGGHYSGGGGHHYGGGGYHHGGGNYYGGGFGYGLGGYGLGGYGLGGLSYGLGGYGYGLNSYGSGLGYGGSYYASPIYRNPGVSYYNSYYPPIVSPSPSYYSAPPALPQAPPSNEARVEAVLPVPDAQVWINGHKTSSVGTRRLYNSPALEPGSPYTYQVTAVWMQNGSEVRVERSVEVFPGRTSLVDFTKVNTSDRTPPPGN